MQNINSILKNNERFKILAESIKRGLNLNFYGLTESQKAFTLSGIYEDTEKPLLIVTSDYLKAEKLYNDISFFKNNEKVYLMPSKEIMPFDISAPSSEIISRRMKVIEAIILNKAKIVITPVSSLFQRLIPLNVFKKSWIEIETFQEIDLDKLKVKLLKMGYEREDTTEIPGTFSIRGGIVDIYPFTVEQPFRVEFFGDQVDSIRTFNPENQRSTGKKEKIRIMPAKEIIFDKELIDEFQNRINRELDTRIKSFNRMNKNEEASNLNSKISDHLNKIKEYNYFDGVEKYITFLYPNAATFVDYFVNPPIIVIDETEQVIESGKGFSREITEIYKHSLEKGEILPSQLNMYETWESVGEKLSGHHHIQISLLPKTLPPFKREEALNLGMKSMQPFYGKFDFLFQEINNLKIKGYSIILLSGTEKRVDSLKKELEEKDIYPSLFQGDFSTIKKGQVLISEGSIEKGFEFPDGKIAILSDTDIFEKAKKKRQKKKFDEKGSAKISSFSDLNSGDYVVHISHGIGKYIGVKTLEVNGFNKDYLNVSYRGGDKLYIPVDQIHLIQKYVGSQDSRPKLNKLGGSDWNRIKNKVKESVREMADELLKLYASREALNGFAFSLDTSWQKEFEEDFPYEETPDQLEAIKQIKIDMESSKPMDRLICGDVGYGKTEVALRGVFKAVNEGKQVCILAPTTILAQQHYKTLTERFKKYPVNIGLLSRFKTPVQQRQTLSGLKQGTVDIVVGTHRLLQKDIKFYDLGLLIVDEEQRFGVSHKEKIKNLKKNVDVITLTATPIPRTLHMSLSGIRDMSVIETPPEDRYPIQTYVVEQDDFFIKDAIIKEISRKGQIYYVFNRVEHIEKEALRLKKLIPEARICVAHGQMKETELERIMLDFYNGEYDVLVCTTIIESGLDIPNVNTIIITNSDRMGLAQLYQLRGRVGRSSRLAYAYITYKKDKVLNEEAKKRLQAIKEFTELGSGFKIAMRDLEIRGAGNILGPQQHGHMMAVGYELYCKLLNDAINEFKGYKTSEDIETNVDLKVSAFISDKFIDKTDQKIDFYKRIVASSEIKEMYDIEEEIEDRYGNIPEETRNLLEIGVIKVLAKDLSITSIQQKENEILINFSKTPNIRIETLIRAIEKNPRKLKLKGGNDSPYLAYKFNNNLKGYKLIKKIQKVLQEIIYLNKEEITA